jgi:hypothetical protein
MNDIDQKDSEGPDERDLSDNQADVRTLRRNAAFLVKRCGFDSVQIVATRQHHGSTYLASAGAGNHYARTEAASEFVRLQRQG